METARRLWYLLLHIFDQYFLRVIFVRETEQYASFHQILEFFYFLWQLNLELFCSALTLIFYSTFEKLWRYKGDQNSEACRTLGQIMSKHLFKQRITDKIHVTKKRDLAKLEWAGKLILIPTFPYYLTTIIKLIFLEEKAGY